MKAKWLIGGATLILAAALAATAAWFRYHSGQKQTVVAVKPEPMSLDISLPAHLQAATVVAVPVPVQGLIEAFHVEIGAEVYAGQLLAQIRSEGLEGNRQAATLDVENARTKINNLEAEITAARLEASRAGAEASRSRGEFERLARNLQRQRVLIAEGATPRNAVEKAQKDHGQAEIESKNLDTAAQQAESRVTALQRDLDLTRKLLETKEADLEQAETRIAAGDISSPVDGVVAGRRGEPGEHVDPSMKDLFQIATDLSSMEAVAEAAPATLTRIRPGQAATVVVAEAANEVFSGVVKSVEKDKVVVQFSNPNPQIKPGLSAQIRIRVAG